MRTKANTVREGVKIHIFADVLYGWPLKQCRMRVDQAEYYGQTSGLWSQSLLTNLLNSLHFTTVIT